MSPTFQRAFFKRECGSSSPPAPDVNMFTDGGFVHNAKQLPLNLLDALRALEKNRILAERLVAFVPSFLKLKHEEWNSYCRHLTEWERDITLDC